MIYHGIQRTFQGTSALLADHGMEPGRINITLRRVEEPTTN